MRLLLWGISATLKSWIENNDYMIDEEDVIGYIDSSLKWKGKTYHGKEVINPDKLTSYQEEFDYVLITSEKYKDEILHQALIIKELEGKVIPFQFLRPVYDGAYSRAYEKVYENGKIRIIKNWFIVNKCRCLVFAVENETGNTLRIRVLQNGGIKGIKKHTDIRVTDIQRIEEVFSGSVSPDMSVDLPIDRNISLFRFEVSGLGRCFASIQVIEGEKTKVCEAIKNAKTKERFIEEISKLSDYGLHDFDYGFLDNVAKGRVYTILDIGANLGQSALTFLRRTELDVVSCEPHPDFVEALEIIKRYYDERFQFISCGVGDKEGILNFYLPKFERDITQEGSFYKERVIERVERVLNVEVTEDNSKEYVETVCIPVKTIDSIVENLNKKILFVKIDAEMFELEVILGMRNLIRTQKPIILLEYNRINIQEEIIYTVNQETEYVVRHWDYTNGLFTEENTCASINYFLIPLENERLKLDCEGRLQII